MDEIQWWVGNGEKIRIWKNRWLPPPCSTLCYSPHQRLEVDARVSNLIDSSTGRWNTQLLYEIFTPDEAERICSVIPSPLHASDSVFWRGTSQGIFMVRSAYHMAMQRRARGLSGCSNAKEEGVLKDIWSLQSPAVVKNIAWKVAHDMLPTKGNLYKKKIASDLACPICLQEN